MLKDGRTASSAFEPLCAQTVEFDPLFSIRVVVALNQVPETKLILERRVLRVSRSHTTPLTNSVPAKAFRHGLLVWEATPEPDSLLNRRQSKELFFCEVGSDPVQKNRNVVTISRSSHGYFFGGGGGVIFLRGGFVSISSTPSADNAYPVSKPQFVHP